ncbi:hypothetical protein DFA_02400 [Cavenderia fasciculata]|uniref:F-box domain-containing protein n=1 Tax=Cavenderia fasciculata TaxID=261658 RepID=F4PZC4_CACFS|nr:uncharacterized protein DFA_02400 [Cavenderia fasciculata]EGG19153.1 hypothetical protein DFA_02400 [Cavenderia fasciculata]|eukprot:XP_004366786.1 hypothetical protein DFA_02400 [Cavenderia fasciculata]
MTRLLSLSNLLLIQIITEIEDNVDLVCLLLTCKKLYNSSFTFRRSIHFKGIGEPINEKGEISSQFTATVSRFNINSFKDILENSISNQYVVLPDLYHPDAILRHTSTNRHNAGTITTVLVNDYEQKFIDSLDKRPSIETLYIDHRYSSTIDLGVISQLPNLQRLSVRVQEFNLGTHTSLKSLKLYFTSKHHLVDLELNRFVSLTELTCHFVSKIAPGLLPITLTSLTLLSVEDIPPQDTFNTLVSLVYLKLELIGRHVTSRGIDLSTLLNLKTFLLDYTVNDTFDTVDYNIEIRVPPSLKILHLVSYYTRIPSQYKMPLLEELNVKQHLLIDGKVSLSSCLSIKKLSIGDCNDIIANKFIPSTIQELTIYKETKKDILGQIEFPPTLLHLTVLGRYSESIHPLPQSLINLKQSVNQSTIPQHLKTLDLKTKLTNLVFKSSYPPHLETLNLYYIDGNFAINIPPITKYLTLSLNPTPNSGSPKIPIYSISSRLNKPIDKSQTQWLPIHTTHLACFLNDPKYHIHISFRLDEIINYTNVRYLSFIIGISTSNTTLKFSIQRLDPDNNNVLVLERQSLTGGIITQRKSINNQPIPIYLYFDTCSYIPYDFKWKFFVVDNKDKSKMDC